MVKYTLLFAFLVCLNANAIESLLADPTQPINYQKKSAVIHKKNRAVLPKLQSILVSNTQRKAILNNKLYQLGQKVNGYLISQIKKDVVILSYKNKRYRLSLYSKKERVAK